MDPVTGSFVAGTVANTIGNVVGGGDQYDKTPTLTGYANVSQGRLQNALLRAYTRGDGEFGFGQAMRQGTSQLDQYLRDSGMPGAKGGIADSLRAAMIGNAASGDAANRR